MRCETCKADFQPRHPRARFCTPACRSKGWQRARAKAQAEREGRLRLLLAEALKVLQGQEGADA